MERALEDDGVLRAAKMIGGMASPHFADADAGTETEPLARILLQRGDKTQAAAFRGGFVDAGLQERFHRFELRIEVLQRAFRQRHDRLDRNILSLQRNAGLAGENQQFSKGVATAQVDPGVVFGQAILLRLP